MKKKNGFTVVELIVSFSLTMVVVVFLFQIILTLKDMYISNGIKSTLLNKQAIINQKLYNDFRSKKIQIASNCGKNCILFMFDDNTKSVLKIDEENETFHYGDYTTKLAEGSHFGSLEAHIETIPNVALEKNDSILQITVPIENTLVSGDFGLNAVYQYNSRITSISNVTFEGSSDNKIYLKGSNEMQLIVGEEFVEPGYFVIDENGNVIDNDSRVVVEGTVGTTPGTYAINYRLMMNGVTIESKVRIVEVIMPQYVFEYQGKEEVFEAPVTGYYQLEAWGAQGGYATSENYYGGYGGYSTGVVKLNKGDKLFVVVGGKGSSCGSGVQKICAGGYNGGGNGYIHRTSNGTAASGGGGATHIATSSGLLSSLNNNRDSILIVAGGGGGSHYDTDGNGYSSVGGHGGGMTGTSIRQVTNETCSAYCNTYSNPSGGTQTTGGLGVSDWTTGTTSSTNYVGTFGMGATGMNSYGGGGGGWYGGASGNYNGGGGGSGYINSNNLISYETITKHMVVYDNTVTDYSSTALGTKTNETQNHSSEAISDYAKAGDGYAKISYIGASIIE